MIPLWLIPLFPLVGTLILAVISISSSTSKKGANEGLVGGIAVLFPALAFLMVLLLSFGLPDAGYRETLCTWFDIQAIRADFGFLFDGLSRTMLLLRALLLVKKRWKPLRQQKYVK